MPLPEEILGRLQVNGATVAGGSSQYAGFIPMLDASGQLHSSLFSNVVIAGIYRVADQAARLALANLKPGDIVVQVSPARAYALRELPSSNNDNWELIGVTNVAAAVNITVDNSYSGSTLSATDLQAVIEELDSEKVSKATAATITAAHTFSTGSAPFTIGGSSIGVLVTGLNADKLDGEDGSFYTNAANLSSGTIPSGRLTGTYAISVTGNATTASLATLATTATTANNAVNATHAATADNATDAEEAIKATNAVNLAIATNDYRPGSYFRNAGNLNAGILLGDRFNDVSHGERSGGLLHAEANETTAGFFSAADFCKLQTISENAEENENVFTSFVGTSGSTSAGSKTATFKFDSDSPALSIIVTGGANPTATFDIDPAQITHADLGGLTADDHVNYVHKSVNRTITAVHTFNASGGVPFVVGANARGSIVTGLNADLLDGQHGAFYQNAANLSSGIVPTARLSGTYTINITGTASGNVPLTGGSTEGPLEVPGLTIGTLNGVLRAVNGEVLDGATTDDLAEGNANLYFTNERLDDRVAALLQNNTHISWTYNDTNGTLTPTLSGIPNDTDDLAEGADNLYLTVARVRAALSAVAPITYNESTGAIGINANYLNVPNTLVYRDSNGDFAARNITVAAPTAGGHAANKTYVDNLAATKAAVDHSHANATSSAAGFMSAADKTNHDTLAVLVDNVKRARSFCPVLRLEGPSTANVLFYNQKSTTVKGDPSKTYTLTVRVRGWFKEQHTWSLLVDDPAATSVIHAASTSLPGPQSSDTYVDEEVALTIKGRSRITLVYYLRDGLIPSAMPGPLAGVAPKDATFNGTYLLIEPVALVGDYNCYTKDILPVSINGEITGGLLSGYSGDDGLNGDDADDIDDIIATYSNATETPEFPDYTADILGKVNASQRKSLASVLNKIEGFNGYLQHQTFVIGREISKPIVADNDALDETLVNSGKTTANIVTSSFSVGGTSATITIGGSTNWQQLLNQISSTSGGLLTASYNPSTDRITIVNSATPSNEHEGDVFYDPAGFLGIIRASANSSHRNSVVSLPVASGVRVSDTLKNANFKLAVYPEAGSFYIDGVVFNYDSNTDTVAGLMATINSALPAATRISYDVLSNTFKLEKEKTNQAPVAFDITGNFLEATRLERESVGNADFSPAAVHCVKLLDERIFAGGSFLNFKGASSAGLAKLDYNKQLFSQFNPDVGFDQPVAFIEPLYGTEDVLVGTFEPSCYRGYNRKYLHRIKPDGTEDTTFNFATQLSTNNGQDRVLKAFSLNNDNDIAVLTPRRLIVVDNTGATLCSYNGTKGFHSFIKYSDNNFLLASTAYSSSAAAQKWDTDSILPLDEPLGLKWLTFNPNNNTIAADSVWLQTPTVVNNQLGAGAGTGAEASCAYPIIGKANTDDAYVIVGNRGNLWGSGYTAFDAVGDTSWNSREVGNLLLRSDRFDNPANPGDVSWPWLQAGNIDVADEQFGTDEVWTTLTRPNANDVSYVEQFVDMETVRTRLDLADVANPGSVQYRYMVKFIQDTGFNNKFPVINVRLTGGSNTNDRQVNCYVNLATGAVTLGTPTPSNLTGVTVNSTTVDGGSGPDTYIVTISFQDDVVANTDLYCTIYPAYATVAGNPVEATTGSCRISGASLMLTAWPNTYVKTTTARKYPAAGSNGIRFRGLYKVGLVGQKKGGADANWNCQLDLTATGDDVHSHPIPFCVDSLDRVYIGGPVKRIKNSSNAWVNVTPWRLYRLTANGYFDKEYEFNDKVLCATITPCNKLIVGGKFSSLGKRFAGKLAFMSVDGALLDSLNNYIDIIAAPIAPDIANDPCLKTKLWLDTSEVPSILKAYNNDSSEWLAAIDVDSLVPRLPKPEFVVTYPVPGQNVNPSAIYLVVPGHSSATIYYAINNDPRVLAFRQDYNPVTGIVLEDAGTFTINAYAVKTNFEDSHLATDTFTVQALVGIIEFTPASGEEFETGGSVTIDVPTTNAESMFYQVSVNGGSYSVEAPYTGSLNVEQNVAIRARASRTGFRDAIASANYTVTLPDPIIAYVRVNQADADSSRIGITLASNVAGSVVKYTLDGSTPTLSSTLYSSTIDLLNNGLYTNNTFTLKAKAFHPDNGTESDVVTEVVTRLTGITPTPSGTGLLEGQALTLAGSGGANEYIRYTINGDVPTEAGSGGVTYTGPIEFAEEDIVNHQVTVKARVFKLGDEPNWHPGIPSALFNVVYTVQMPPPTISTVNDPSLGITRIVLTSVNPQTPTASIIRYTTDGSTPSKLSNNASTTTYVAPGIITANIPENHFINGVVTLKVIEYYPADNYTPAVASQTFTRAAALSALVPANNVVVFGEPVTITPATNDDYNFYYSTNQNGVIDGSSIGTLYNELTGLIFTNAQIQNGAVALKVRTFRSGFIPSSTTSTTYSMKLPLVYFDPFSGSVNPGSVAMYNLVNGVTIKYTRNGAAPNNSSITYTTPVTVLISATFKAKAIKADWIDSEVSTGGYISTLYPNTPDHSLFNIKFGEYNLGVTKAEVFQMDVGGVKFQGRQTTGPLANKNIFSALNDTAVVESAGSYYSNVDKSQVKVSGQAAFGLTGVDFWNSLDIADNENWKSLRNYGATGNFGNYLEARKFFGCSRAALAVDPRVNDGPILNPHEDDAELVHPSTAPTLLQNSGLTATPDSTNKHVMAHVRGLAPGKYLVLAYGRKTRFGIDMYSGTSVTGAEFYNYGIPELKQKKSATFRSSTNLDWLFYGTTNATQDGGHPFQNPKDALWYEHVSVNLAYDGYLTSTEPQSTLVSGLVTTTVVLPDEDVYGVALVESTNDNEIEFHINGRFESGAAVGTNTDSKPIICGVQIIPIEGYWQPTINNEAAVLDIGAFDSADYAMFHVHGGVNVGGTQPKFAGGFYRFIHSIEETGGNINSPDMESATTPSGIVTVQTEDQDHPGWHAMDGDNDTYWLSTAPTSYLEYDFSTVNVVDRYTITAVGGADALAPKDWTLQAFDGIGWVVLDTQSNQFVDTAALSTKEYVIHTPIPCIKYRLVPSASNGGMVKLHGFSLVGKIEDLEGETTFINLPEVGRYKTGEEASANFTANQLEFHHKGGNMQIAFHDISGNYGNNAISAGLIPPAENANANPIAPIFALINISKISAQGKGAGLPVLFNPVSGTVDPESVVLYVNDKPVETIFYTMDGTTPTENSAIYVSPLVLENSTTIKAFAVFEDGTIGPISQATYTMSPRLPTPRFAPPNGSNTPTTVTIWIEGHPDAEIWYTDDGTIPSTTNGNLYSDPVAIDGTITLKAIGYKSGYRKSLIGVASYAPPDYSFGQLPPVTFSPSNSVPLPFPVSVTMTCPGHPDATIIYEIDGTDPTYVDDVYPGSPVPVATGVVKAFAVKLQYAPSDISSITYTQANASDPTFSPDPATPVPLHSMVTLSSSLSGSAIYYSLDGTDPTP